MPTNQATMILWLPQETRLLHKLAKCGKRIQDIAKELKRSPVAVRVHMRKQGIRTRPLTLTRSTRGGDTVSKITEAHKQRIIKLADSGKTANEIKPKFHGKYTRQQVAAVIAWHTMGKY